jgi:type IV secretion system protein VirB11
MRAALDPRLAGPVCAMKVVPLSATVSDAASTLDLESSGPRKASAARVMRMLETAMGETVAGLLKNPDVIEIRCNADGKIYADWFDRPSDWTGEKISPEMATQVICIVADAVDQIIGASAHTYILDAEFPVQGFRFHGDLPPVVPAPCFNIRKRPPRIISLTEYVEARILTERQREVIVKAVRDRKNILVVGGTKSGKTTLTNAVIDEIRDLHQRVATIEKVLELQIRAKEWHSYRVIEGVHDAAQLVEGCLRVAPDRIIVGEVRGCEINAMLEAWGTGHPGGICTLHSDTATPVQALRRVETLIRKSGQVPIPDLIADTIHIIIPIQAIEQEIDGARRFRRLVGPVVRVLGFEDGKYQFETIDS